MEEFQDDIDVLIVSFLENRLSGDDLHKFFDWVCADKKNERHFFELKALHDSRSFLPVDMNESWNRLELKLKRKESEAKERKRLMIRWMSSSAAVLLLLIGFSWYFIWGGFNREEARLYSYSTGGSPGLVLLPDGTSIKLGANTYLSYTSEYGKSDRAVQLNGEGFFEVARNESNPFTVTSGDQCIQVLGTKFNVRSYPSDSVFITTLLEGSVKFTASNIENEKILKPGEQLKYNRTNTRVEVREVDTDEAVSWLNNYYTFQPKTLKEILARMSHIYNVEFECEDTVIMNTVFRGTFYQGQDLDDFLDVIRIASGLKPSKENGKIILYK